MSNFFSSLFQPNQVGTSNTTNTTVVPPYVSAAQQALLGAGLNLTAPFLTNQPSSLVAGFTPDQQTAFDLAGTMAQQAFTTPPIQVNGSTGIGGVYANPTAANVAAASAAPASATAASAAAAQLAPFASMTAAQIDPAVLAQMTPLGNIAMDVASQLTPQEIESFFNPYQQDVVNTTTQQLTGANDRALAAIRARQAAEGAYGGNRGALEEMEQNRNFGNTLASTVAGLNNTGWNTAAQLGQGNAQLRQQTGLANQNAQNQFTSLNSQLGTQVSLANSAQQNQLNALQAQLEQQASMSNQQAENSFAQLQAQLDQQAALQNAAWQQQTGLQNAGFQQQTGLANAGFQQQANMLNSQNQQQADLFNAAQALQVPQVQNALNMSSWQQQLQGLQAILGAGNQQQQLTQSELNAPFTALSQLAGIVPNAYGQTSTTAQPIYGPTTGQTLMSLLPLGLAGASALGLSDETMKKDKDHLGKDPRTGLNIYSYRFKGAAPNSPKAVGPMAQEVERKYPGSTARIGGKLHIKGAAKSLLGI